MFLWMENRDTLPPYLVERRGVQTQNENGNNQFKEVQEQRASTDT